MTVTIKNRKMNRQQLELEISFLKDLVLDLERILLADYPNELELNSAPMITNW